MKTKLLLKIISILLIISIFPLNAEEPINPIDPAGELEDTTTTSTIPQSQDIDETIEQEQSVKEKLQLTGENTATANNIKIQRDSTTNNLNKITFLDKGTITINGYTYSDLKPIKDKPPEIHLDTDGKIQQASFTTNKVSTIVLGNEILENLPIGTQVIYNDKKATITYPKNANIKLPKETIDDKLGESIFYFQYQGLNQFNLPNGDKIYTTQLGSKNGKLFFDSTEAKINQDMEIKNPEKVITYLDFNGKSNPDYDSAYISYDKTKARIILGNNAQTDGPAIKFLENNPYGLKIESNDHLAFKVLKGEKSFALIQNRNDQGKSPAIGVIGNIVMNQDTASFYTKDNNLWMRAKEIILTEFGEQKATSTVPLEFRPHKEVDGKYELVSLDERVLVLSNSKQWGYGGDPERITIGPYSRNNPALKKRVSNRLYYNYPTVKGFEKKFNIPITIADTYSQNKFTKDKLLMLMDIADGLTPTSRRWLQEDGITIKSSAGGGAIAWGWAGGISVAADHLTPNTIRHEMAHSASLGRSNQFWRGWYAVGGASTAFTSNYGTTNEMEDVAEYGGEFIYKDTKYHLTQHPQAKYYRAKLAYLTKWNIFSQKQFDEHMSKAGLETGKSAIDKYIKAVTG
jgi:hypothetical protein